MDQPEANGPGTGLKVIPNRPGMRITVGTTKPKSGRLIPSLPLVAAPL
jgi:hypothetical protein